jgi:cytidylate kinase
MPADIALERCKTFIHCQLQTPISTSASRSIMVGRPVITLSRETGAGARTVAHKLADYLDQHDADAPCPWTVFDKNLITKVLEDHHLPQRLAQYFCEDKRSSINDAVEELLGLHPSQWTLVEKTTDTIFRLAQMGNVILVGRGAAVIAGKLPNAFHVRLVGALERRVAHVQEYRHLDTKEALEHVVSEDRHRKGYLKTYFGQDFENPLLYHLTINTDLVGFDEAAEMLGESILRRMRHRQNTE